MKRKIWEVIKVVLIVVILTGGVGGGWYYLMHRNNSQQSTKLSPQDNRKQTKKVVNLVALGDSLTQGVGDEQNAGGYVSQIKQQLTKKQHVKINTHNFGKAGDRSDQILTRLQNSAKFKTAVKKADVLVLTVGGNDLVQTLEKNVTNQSTQQTTNAVNKAQTAYVGKLQRLLQTIRQDNPKAPLFCFSIYNPVYVYFANVTQLQGYIDQWNQQTKTTLSSVATTYFVDINQQLSAGQYQSRAAKARLKRDSKQANLGTLNSSSLSSALNTKISANRYISDTDHFHPNHAGYRLMTDALYQAMQTHSAWKYQH